MKYIISLVFFSVLVFGFDYHLKPSKVSEGVECFFGLDSIANEQNGGDIINSCYIQTEEGYVVIDSGPSYGYAQQANSIINENKENKLPVKYLINTTAEETHFLGNNFYKEQGAILIGPKGYKQYENGKALHLPKTIGEESFQNTRIVSLDEYVESDRTIYVGTVEIKIIKIISNSDQYLIVYLPQQNIIFTGDMIFNNRIPSLKSGRSLLSWLKALDVIEKISGAKIVSAHGRYSKSQAVENTKSYLTILKDRVSSKIKNRERKESIVENTEMLSFSGDALYEKCHKKNLSLAYDELKKISLERDDYSSKKINQGSKVDIKYYDFNEGLEEATKHKKILLLKVRSNNCSFCNELDEILEKNSRVKSLINQNFVMVTMDNLKDRLPLDITIVVTPSLVFIQPDTQEVKMIIPGIEGEEELMDTLKEGIEDGKKDGYLN